MLLANIDIRQAKYIHKSIFIMLFYSEVKAFGVWKLSKKILSTILLVPYTF